MSKLFVSVRCEATKLDQLFEYADQQLGDRLLSASVDVNFTIEGTEADLEIFKSNSAPIEMITDWENES